MLNPKQKKYFICTLMAALLLSVASTSMANARTENVTSPPTPAESGQAPADTPNLIMTLNSTATEPDNQGNQPNLHQAQDNPSVVDDNSTLVIAPYGNAGSAEQNSFTATQTPPDFSVLIAGCASLLVAAFAVGMLMFVRRRKAD
jgi:hypothetical protein